MPYPLKQIVQKEINHQVLSDNKVTRFLLMTPSEIPNFFLIELMIQTNMHQRCIKNVSNVSNEMNLNLIKFIKNIRHVPHHRNVNYTQN